MHPPPQAVLTLLSRIDAQRAALLAAIETLDPAEQRIRPSPAAWSALEILEHLVLAEQVVLGDLAVVDTRPDIRPSPGERFRARIVWLVLRFGIRVRADGRMHPSGTGTFDTWRTQWDAQHAALRALVTRMDATALARHLFRHPVGGPLTTPQALRLLSAHLRTHARQLFQLQRSLRRVRA